MKGFVISAEMAWAMSAGVPTRPAGNRAAIASSRAVLPSPAIVSQIGAGCSGHAGRADADRAGLQGKC
jgi:hypothetical protein